MDAKTLGGPRRRDVLVALAVAAAGELPVESGAQGSPYPNRPIRLIVPWAAGGGGDVLVRAITPSLSRRLGQTVVVDNRPGAIGTIGSLAAARSPADGYTLLYGTADSHSIAPHILKSIAYDAKKDFVPVALIGFTPLALVVHSSHPARQFGQFLRWAREAREPRTFGSWGQGSSGHITVEALKEAARVNLLHIPYTGTAPLVQAQLANQVDCSILPVLVAEPYVQAGKVRALVMTARERLPSHADVPIMKEIGVNIEMGPWLGILAPAGLPPDVTAKLSDAIAGSIAEPAVAENLKRMMIVVDVMSPRDYQRFYDGEYERWGRYIRAGKISLE